jgi:aspartate-semialdehyde dehydrogenase
MLRVAFVGWRGLVGGVLMDRMRQEGDFDYQNVEYFYFSTSQAGREINGNKILDANNPSLFVGSDIIVTCQGSEWSKKMYPAIKSAGWDGIWLDSSSAFRKDNDSIIVLDPVNYNLMIEGLKNGVKKFVGGNCTVSLMLMACQGLIDRNLVEWIDATTYQAASGAGAKNMLELLTQTDRVSECFDDSGLLSDDPIYYEGKLRDMLRRQDFPREHFEVPLALNLIPWIDKDGGSGWSDEELKGEFETNKTLGLKERIWVDYTCVRVGALRCHSQSLTLKLKQKLSTMEVANLLSKGNQFVWVIPNNKERSIMELTPLAVSGTLNIRVGRIRISTIDPTIIKLFTVGDQLLWGAAEPIRRALKIILKHLEE